MLMFLVAMLVALAFLIGASKASKNADKAAQRVRVRKDR